MDFPIKNGASFHSYVNVYQRVNYTYEVYAKLGYTPCSDPGRAPQVLLLLYTNPLDIPTLVAEKSMDLFLLMTVTVMKTRETLDIGGFIWLCPMSSGRI